MARKRKPPQVTAVDDVMDLTTKESPPSQSQPRKKHKKAKRKLSAYNVFVREKYSLPEVQAASVRDRLKIIGKMWQEHKKNMSK